jgi:vacuolar-type H+-ATPase subunit F/Vma7
MSIGNLNIAVIGDEDLISGLRLAGVVRYHIVVDDRDIIADVGKVLTELIDDPDVGIIAMREDYLEHVEDILNRVKEERRLTPVIIGVPSKFGAKYEDVTEYYKSYVRKFTGFDIEI